MAKKFLVAVIAYITFPLAMLVFSLATGANPVYGLIGFIVTVFILQQFERRKLPEDVTFVDWVSEKVFG